MSEWKKVKLGDYCEITSSKRCLASVRSKNGIPFFCSKEIICLDKGEDFEPTDFIPEELYNDIKAKYGVPTGGDLLLTTRGTNGIPYIYKPSDKFYFADGNLSWFKNFGKELSPQYLYYWFKSPLGIHEVDAISKGTAQKAVPIDGLRRIVLLTPSLHTQNRIVVILSRYDSLIENYQKQIKLLEEAAQRLYKEWFVDLRFPGHENTKIVDGVPEGWEKKKLIDLVDVQYGYAFDGHLFNSKEEGTPIVRIRNIPDGYTNDYTTEEASESYIINDGDILVGMDGIFHINTWSGGKAFLVQRACSFRPKDDSMKGFILQAIYEPIKFFENTVVGATVAHLGKKHIDSIELLVSKNVSLYKPFEKMFNERQTLKSQLRLLTEARDRLLPKLMSGEITV